VLSGQSKEPTGDIFIPHEKAILVVKCDFSYSCAAADKISTDLRALAVSLRQLSYLFLCVCKFANFYCATLSLRRSKPSLRSKIGELWPSLRKLRRFRNIEHFVIKNDHELRFGSPYYVIVDYLGRSRGFNHLTLRPEGLTLFHVLPLRVGETPNRA